MCFLTDMFPPILFTAKFIIAINSECCNKKIHHKNRIKTRTFYHLFNSIVLYSQYIRRIFAILIFFCFKTISVDVFNFHIFLFLYFTYLKQIKYFVTILLFSLPFLYQAYIKQHCLYPHSTMLFYR